MNGVVIGYDVAFIVHCTVVCVAVGVLRSGGVYNVNGGVNL